MRVEDFVIQVRSLALGALGEIDKGYVNDLKVVKRFNNVGSWHLSLPTEYSMALELAQPGRGIKISGPGWSFTGRMLNATHKDSVEDPAGTLFFVGCDDMIHLADALAFPDPAVADPDAQTQAYDVRTGNAETVVRAYVDANIGPSSPVDRQIGEVALQTNLNRGATITGRARFDNLGQLISDCAAQGGGLGFDMLQVGSNIEFHVYEPQDKSGTIRMDIDNDMLLKTEYGFGAPTATRAIVAGQGEGVGRKILKVTSTASLSSETAWGRKIEVFKDRRDTNQDVELTQEGDQIVTANGVTKKSLSVVPADDIPNQEFGLDWFLGDIVGVIVDGQNLASTVTEAVIIMDERGVRVGATLGDPVGFDYDAKLVAAQKDHEKRLASLEKNNNAPPSAALFPVGTVMAWLGATIPSWALELKTQDVSRTTYSALFAVLGTAYGAGDGSTTFGIPSAEGMGLIGQKALLSIGTATVTIASPGVVTRTAHGLADGQRVSFTTTGALPTGLVVGTRYFVRNSTANTFQLSSTATGAVINTSGTQSGTHTLHDADFIILGEQVGARSHLLQASESGLPEHFHVRPAAGNATPSNTSDGMARGSGTLDSGFRTGGVSSSSAYGSGTLGAQAASMPHNNVGPAIVVKWIIVAATSAGEFDTVVQASLVSRVGDVEAEVDDLQQWSGSNRPAFHAASSSDQTKSGAASFVKVNFDNEILDTEGNYDSALSRFVAPVAGLYQFDVYCAATGATSGPELALYKNGAMMRGNLAVGYGLAFMTFGASVVELLAAGDYVEVFVQNNNGVSITFSNTRCRFSGHYIG